MEFLGSDRGGVGRKGTGRGANQWRRIGGEQLRRRLGSGDGDHGQENDGELRGNTTVKLKLKFMLLI